MIDQPRAGLGQAERLETPTTPVWHPDFSANARSRKSLVYSSADGTLFALNEARVACNASALPRAPPPAEAPVHNSGVGPTNRLSTGREPIPLPESTETLSILFRFILPRTPPSLMDLAIDDLVNVVQAARNYKVYTVVSFGESRLLSLAAHYAEIVFLYGIKNRLPYLMDAGAPAVYRDVKREELLEICNTHGMLYAWLLWDRLIEDICNMVTIGSASCNDCTISYRSYSIPKNRSPYRTAPQDTSLTTVSPCTRNALSIYEHYKRLGSLQWTKAQVPTPGSPEYLSNLAEVPVCTEAPKVSYLQFLGMLDDYTTVDRDIPRSHWCTCQRDSGQSKSVVEYVNDTLKKRIEDLPKFSSFLDSSQKDGDVRFERDDLDSGEEEDGSG